MEWHAPCEVETSMSERQMREAEGANAVQQSAAEILAAATVEQHQRTLRLAAERVVDAPSRNRVAWMGIALITPVLAVVLAVNMFGVSSLALLGARPRPEAARDDARQLLETLVADIEAFRNDNDELPESLVEIGMPPRGQWRYEPAPGGGYRLEGVVSGQTVTFTRASTDSVAKGTR